MPSIALFIDPEMVKDTISVTIVAPPKIFTPNPLIGFEETVLGRTNKL